jgi:cellobiose phosphorylase
MYRLLLESLLGLTRTATHLKLEPRMPQDWNSFSLATATPAPRMKSAWCRAATPRRS